jgi:hypothetical protein
MQIPRRNIACAMAALATALLAAGCAAPPKEVTVGDTFERTFTVAAIDHTSRLVTLRDGQDSRVIYAGPQVRNLAQVKAGDRVVVRYTEAIAAEIVKPGAGVSGVQSAGVAMRSAPGERPAAATAEQTRMTVKVFDVDTIANVVEVTGPSGYNRRVAVKDPKAREFIRGLKRGDEVMVTITEAAAISVEPAR